MLYIYVYIYIYIYKNEKVCKIMSIESLKDLLGFTDKL